MTYRWLLVTFCLILLYFALPLNAQTTITLWVDPLNGDDSADGGETTPLLTLTEAYRRIPMGETLATGYTVHLLSGDYSEEAIPSYWESRYGTQESPIIIQGGGEGVNLPALSIYDTHYLTLRNLNVRSDVGLVLHCEACYHLTLDSLTLVGSTENSRETLKINQSQYVFLRNNDISGATDNPVDFVAVQYGEITDNRIHNGSDWCMYLKGGSAHFNIERNELFDCFAGGFTAGQSTGLEFMVAPWLQYEAYGLRFVNNIVHDVTGAAVGVNGGYNILIAYNTFYSVGTRSHGIEVNLGSRSCDGDVAQCEAYLAAGGWGTSIAEEVYEPIPNKNVSIYNNLLYNPTGVASEWQHFTIDPPRSPSPNSNIPDPAVTDENLQICRNVLWNGPKDLYIGIESDVDSGCNLDNPTCNLPQLRLDNTINTLEPIVAEDYTTLLSNYRPVAIPEFVWDVEGALQPEWPTAVTTDFNGNPRTPENDQVGAFVSP